VFVTVPLGNLDYQAPDGEDAVQWNTAQADRLFGEIRTDQPVIKPAPAPSKSQAAAKNGKRHAASAKKTSHPQGWVPPGARTAAQAACH
jgi:topoisomerase IA-like protein